jgi:hypothetical protein
MLRVLRKELAEDLLSGNRQHYGVVEQSQVANLSWLLLILYLISVHVCILHLQVHFTSTMPSSLFPI